MAKALENFYYKLESGITYYPKGSEFPGTLEVSQSELNRLATSDNDVGRALIELSEDNIDSKDLTVAEIKAILDEQGIEYDSKAKKAELLELLEQ